MAKQTKKGEPGLVKVVYPARPGWDYFLPKHDPAVAKKLMRKHIFPRFCDRPCTKIMTLFPKKSVDGHTGYGYYMINVAGYRIINAYVISDPLNSTNQRGFTLELSFSLHDFVSGVGVIGETSYFYNFENFFNPGTLSQRTLRCETSDLTTAGGLPWIGGTDLTHILRVPVMGPYIRASVFNEDTVTRQAEVKAYLST